MTDPWLTVVMPTYNGAEFIRATLDSLAAQTEGGFEVVALDEASTDGTPEIIAEYANRFPIRQIDGAGLNGWIAKTNRGFELARTPYATMLHQDDFWRPGRMAALRRALDEAAEAPVFVVHPVDFVDGAGRVIGKWSPPPSLGRGLVSPGDMLTRLCIQNFIAIPGSIFSSEAARSVGGVEADMRYTGDWDFYLKLARAFSPSSFTSHAAVEPVPSPTRMPLSTYRNARTADAFFARSPALIEESATRSPHHHKTGMFFR